MNKLVKTVNKGNLYYEYLNALMVYYNLQTGNWSYLLSSLNQM